MKYVQGNLLTADTQALVNTVNTVGVMGKGIALQFKEKYPNNFRQYASACKNKMLAIGDLLVVKEQTWTGEKLIVNFPTKTEWYQKSKYEYIEAGLKKLVEVIGEHRITSIALPPLGCGNGGLRWDKVKMLIEKYLGGLTDVRVVVYEPNDQVKALLNSENQPVEVRLTPARAMLLYGLFFYEDGGEYISRVIANKIAYFLQRLGEPDFQRLQFTKSHYGPYSAQVDAVLYHLDRKYLNGMKNRTAGAFQELTLCYDRLDEIKQYVATQLTAAQRTRLERLMELLEVFESAMAIEVLATVDFIQKEYPNANADEIIAQVHNWSARKRNFSEHHLRIGIQHLDDYKQRLPF